MTSPLLSTPSLRRITTPLLILYPSKSKLSHAHMEICKGSHIPADKRVKKVKRELIVCLCVLVCAFFLQLCWSRWVVDQIKPLQQGCFHLFFYTAPTQDTLTHQPLYSLHLTVLLPLGWQTTCTQPFRKTHIQTINLQSWQYHDTQQDRRSTLSLK